MSRRPRQLVLPEERQHGPLLAFDPIELEIITAGLTRAAAGAFLPLLLWSWQHGPLPASRAGRAAIARTVNDREFRAVWRELQPLLKRRPRGYVSPWLEVQRSKRDAIRSINAENGRASGRARRKRTMPQTADRSPRLAGRAKDRPDHRPRATFEVLCAFATKELWDRYDAFTFTDALGQQVKPTIHDLKELAGKFFNWSDDPDLPDRAFNASEEAHRRRHEIGVRRQEFLRRRLGR